MDRAFRRIPVWLTVALIAATGALVPLLLQAGTTFYDGCLICVERTILTYPRDYCQQVGNEEHGDGITCKEETWGDFQYCTTSGGAC